MFVKIPSEISVGGQEISVAFKERIEGDVLGECCVAEGYIHIANTFSGSKQNHDSQVNTFYHEVTHAILNTMGEKELNENEKFVSCFSSFLCEAMKNACFVEDNNTDNEIQGDNR